MESIQIWKIESSQAQQLIARNAVDLERTLEDNITKTPALLMEDLTLVGRQTSVNGGALDLLGINPDGKLCVFELKRGTLSRDAVAQVIDYASYLDRLAPEHLAQFIAENSGGPGLEPIKNFRDWYEEQFSNLESLKPVQMFLVGLGVDESTTRMVSFLAKQLDISLITFHGFEYRGEVLLAKKIDAEPVKQSSKSAREKLAARVERLGVESLFAEITGMFREQWSGRYSTFTRGTRLGIRFRETGGFRGYARLDLDPEEVRTIFYPRAVRLCPDEFQQAMSSLSELSPRTHPNDAKMEMPYPEVHFTLSSESWPSSRQRMTSLVSSISESFSKKEQEPDDDAHEG